MKILKRSDLARSWPAKLPEYVISCGLVFGLTLFWGLSAKAQHADLRMQYPILQTELNQLEYPGDSTALYPFYQRLDTLLFEGRGTVNVLHIGGSHVQGGVLSNALRRHLLHLAPHLQTSRGFFFPFSLAKTNNPSNYKVRYTGRWEGCRCSVNRHHCDWGMSGITASTTTAGAEVTVYALDVQEQPYRFDGFRIYYQMEKGSYIPLPDSTLLALTDTLYYDSAAQYVEYRLHEAADTLRFSLQAADSGAQHFTLMGLEYLYDAPGLVYHSIGVNGASTESYLRCGNFAAQLRAIKPDLVIFGIGINDAYVPQSYFKQSRFEGNYEELMSWFTAANPDVSFLFLTNNDSFYKRRYANPNALKVSAGMRNLAKRHNTALWDLLEIMGGFNSIHVWQEYGLAKRDKLHFTPSGYRLQADLLFAALKSAYGDYLQSRYQAEQP